MSEVSLETIHREVVELHEKMERIEELIESKLVGIDEPTSDEAEAIKRYAKAKKSRGLELISLEDAERMLK